MMIKVRKRDEMVEGNHDDISEEILLINYYFYFFPMFVKIRYYVIYKNIYIILYGT